MYWVIKLDQGDYLLRRGGLDWGRCESIWGASPFETPEDAQRFADTMVPLSSFRGIVKQEH